MLFVCYSSLDRDLIVKPLLYHLYEFGINIWYDHKKLFLSNEIPIAIYKDGIIESTDILIIYSKNLTKKSKCGRAELDIIYKNKEGKNIYPVLFRSDMDDFQNNDYKLLSNTIHYKINESNLYQVAVQIAIKILENSMKNRNYKKFHINEYELLPFVMLYQAIPPFNLREQAIALMALINIQLNKFYNLDFSELKLKALKNYFDSLITLNCNITENDVRLLELLAILVIGC